MSKARAALFAHRNELIALAAKYDLSKVRIFGSIARGTDDDQSDVDLLVDWAQMPSLLALGGFLMDARDLLGVQVDVMSEGMLKPRLREQVLSEAIPL